jgi:putative DNA primase/helicase
MNSAVFAAELLCRMTTVEFVSRLDLAKQIGTGWTARCPAHDDRAPSLSVTEGDDGRTLIKCHAGCATIDIVKAMGLRMSDLFIPRPPRPVVRTV